MRIGVIGSGQVGQTLAQDSRSTATRCASAAVRRTKLADFSRRQGFRPAHSPMSPRGRKLSCSPCSVTRAEEALREAGAANLDGKLVMDTTNPISNEPPEDGVVRYFTSPNESLMERLQARFRT